MFRHIFLNRLKCLLRDKQLIFWNLAFPILMATLFFMAFSNMSGQEAFRAIDVAVVDDAHYNQATWFKAAMEHVSQDGDGKLFNITLSSAEGADELLKDGKIAGYIYLDPEPHLVVKNSGLKQTVIKAFLDSYKSDESAITGIFEANPHAAIDDVVNDFATYKEYTREVSPSRGKPDNTVNYFYTLIAMTCMYGCFFGLKEIMGTQGDQSKRAARVNMAPVNKLKVFIYGMAAAFIVQYAMIILVLCFMRFALGIDFGNQYPFIFLLCFVGCAAGMFFGTMVTAWIRGGEGVKVGVLIAVSLAWCFLAGMQYPGIKYMIEKNVPALAYINPATLITDGLYALYYYNTHERFFLNIILLAVLSVLFCMATYFTIRRRKYASL